MKKIGVKTKKTIAATVLVAAIAILAGLTGRLLVLGVTTDAMEIGWSDWVRNRNYEDSWTLSEHVGSDLRTIVEYVGLKQLLEEEDGTVNLNRPALVVENADGSRRRYSMQDLIDRGEEYGIYLYRPVGGCMEIRETDSYVESEPVRVLWELLNEADARTELSEDAWAVREERASQALSAPKTEEEAFVIPSENELWELSAQELLTMLKQVPESYKDEGELVSPEELAAWEEYITSVESEQGPQENEDTAAAETVPADSGEEARPEVAYDPSVEEALDSLRSEMVSYLNLYRDQNRDEDTSNMYSLTRRFLWNCLWSYYHCQYLLEDTDSNLSYQIILEKGNVRRVYGDPDTPADTVLSTDQMNAYYSYDSASQKMDSTLGDWSWLPHVMLKNRARMNYDRATIVVGLDTGHMVYEDSYSMEAVSYAGYRGQVFGASGTIAGCLLVILVMMVWLMFLSGHKEGVEGIYLNGYDRIPTELGACGIFILFAGFAWGIWLLFEILTAYTSYQKAGLSAPTLIGALAVEVLLIYLMLWLGFYGLIRRIKARTFWKNSLTARFLGWCMKPVRWCGGRLKRLWDMLLNAGDTTWKTLAMFCAYFIINFVWGTSLRYSSGLSMLLYLAFNGAVGVCLVWKASQMKRVHAGVKKIADGSLDYHLPLDNLSGEARRLAIQINRISVGLKNAIEASVKNERMKTDLITNVSHDIKTPLTSIINYVDLLKREQIEDTRIQGYIDVLDKKSQRLKTLTEDLVEASKASSGTLQLNLEKIDFIELINQTSGEFMDRFEAKGLTVVPSVPAEPAYIMADGRYVWRILENLYRNAEKYAMPGTRVYIDVFEKFGRIFFVMKNVSQAPLNIKADELTERFIRGDVSRSTEGSGLGLSIAKDMTELMNGTFKIYLDGDLFRVTISFVVISEKKTDLKEMEESIRRRLAEEEAKAGARSDAASEMEPASDDFEPDLWDRIHIGLPKLHFGLHREKKNTESREAGQKPLLQMPGDDAGGYADDDFLDV